MTATTRIIAHSRWLVRFPTGSTQITSTDRLSPAKGARQIPVVSALEVADRIREPGARIHRAGVVQMRPILEQFVVGREVAIVEHGTELFEKIQRR